MERISLNGAWRGTCFSEAGTPEFRFDGTVPGSSLSDLCRCGQLPADLFYRGNAAEASRFERCSFLYEKDFTVSDPEAGEWELSFERLDTYCQITLNGTPLGKTVNGHIRHTFSVSGLLRENNHLELRFLSPVTETDGLPKRDAAFTAERLYIRRVQCTFGWDWVIRLVSCGICGEVTLCRRQPDEIRMDGVYVYTRQVDEDAAQIGITLDFRLPYRGRILRLSVTSPDGEEVRSEEFFADHAKVCRTLDIPEPRLWYPRGYGEHPLYCLHLFDGETEIFRQPFGIRTVRILQLPDAPESEAAEKCRKIANARYDQNTSFSGFILKINGVRIFCRGANWVPCKPFEDGGVEEKIPQVLDMAEEMGLNMIRIWGGGDFERPLFYDECSRRGILVTQDFLMACGDYPEEQEWFLTELRREAEYAAKLIRNQPCLVWWSGDNENAVHGCDTDENYRGRRSAYLGIAPALRELDPMRDFLPSSPYGGKLYASNTVGTTHNTQFLSRLTFPFIEAGDCSDYREFFKRLRARFIAEESQLGAAGEISCKRFMTEEDLTGGDTVQWRYHMQSNPGFSKELLDYMDRFATSLLGAPANNEDRNFKYRYLQYEWVRVQLEQARREKWFCSGVIFWMLNDCWPASAGWALIDYYNCPKDAFYSFRRCAKPMLACLDREDGELRLILCDDGRLDTGYNAVLLAVSADGKTVRKVGEASGSLRAGTNETVWRVPEGVIGKDEILIADCRSDLGSDRAFYAYGNLPMERCPADVRIDRDAGTVTVRASEYVHAVEIDGILLASDNCFSLLPGEERTVSYRPLEGDTGEIAVSCFTVRKTGKN